MSSWYFSLFFVLESFTSIIFTLFYCWKRFNFIWVNCYKRHIKCFKIHRNWYKLEQMHQTKFTSLYNINMGSKKQSMSSIDVWRQCCIIHYGSKSLVKLGVKRNTLRANLISDLITVKRFCLLDIHQKSFVSSLRGEMVFYDCLDTRKQLHFKDNNNPVIKRIAKK